MAQLSSKLTFRQSHALLDILSHHDVYAQIQDFRFPNALSTYGPPFSSATGKPSTSPALQALVSKFLLPLPGLRNCSQEFWQTRCASIVDDLAAAELSESYDKAHIGIRKTLATAAAALVEYPARGVFAGFDKPDLEAQRKKEYDVSKSSDLQSAFRDFMHQIVYGGIIDDVFAKAAETDKLADHIPLVQAAHEFGLVNLASFLHYALILSPKGQYLLTLIDHANKLIPYTVMKQTLKIGNVASMINAMMKVILAKMSVTSLTNWIGWTSKEDEGMNLLQHIIFTVMHWDIRDLKSRATKIEKDKSKPSAEQLKALKEYPARTREEHDAIREKSRVDSKSIVLVILDMVLAPPHMSYEQHQLCLEYLAIQLSIRDREQIIKVLCKSQPDHLTQAVRDMVSAYEPVIRSVHDAVDLSETITDFEHFLKDLIKLSKLPSSSSSGGATHLSAHRQKPTPTVGDFVQLLRKHQSSSHRFLHQVAKNGKEVTSWFYEYANHAASQFKRSTETPAVSSTDSSPQPSAGDLQGPLETLFASLSDSTQAALLPTLDQHASYLDALHAASSNRLHAVVSSAPSTTSLALPATGPVVSTNPSEHASTASPMPSPRLGPSIGPSSSAVEADPGPGAYLARWQNLLDGTALSPTVPPRSRVRTGGNTVPSGAEDPPPSATDSSSSSSSSSSSADADAADDDDDDFQDSLEKQPGQLGLPDVEKVAPPDAAAVVHALSRGFRDLLAQRACDW